MIIFIDIDGVFNRYAICPGHAKEIVCYKFVPELAKNFSKIIDPEDTIITNSSGVKSENQFQRFLSEMKKLDVDFPIHQVTNFAVQTHRKPFDRSDTIRTFLKTHGLEDIPWIAVDDEFWSYSPEDRGRLIHINSYLGFFEGIIDAAIELKKYLKLRHSQ